MFLLTGCITTTRIQGKSGMRIAKDGVHHHFITLLACILNPSIHLIILKCPSGFNNVSQPITHPSPILWSFATRVSRLKHQPISWSKRCPIEVTVFLPRKEFDLLYARAPTEGISPHLSTIAKQQSPSHKQKCWLPAAPLTTPLNTPTLHAETKSRLQPTVECGVIVTQTCFFDIYKSAALSRPLLPSNTPKPRQQFLGDLS